MPAIRRILVPIDWSEPSKCAFRWAASLAQQHGAELIILYVVPLPTVMYGPAPDNYLKHMREELDRIKPADPTTRIDHLLAEGDPATAIVHAAGENQCDLIVMGTHARTGLNRLLVGSVAEEVARKAPCPVLTVKTEVAADSIGRARTHEEVKEPSN
jgi:nucleotide-binding universal stress UspA family protein